jgi:hypothetical protein
MVLRSAQSSPYVLWFEKVQELSQQDDNAAL